MWSDTNKFSDEKTKLISKGIRDFLLKDNTYNQIFEYLISTYNFDTPYNQLFQKQDGQIIAEFKKILNVFFGSKYHQTSTKRY